MTPYYDDGRFVIYQADALEALRDMADDSVDLVLTMPDERWEFTDEDRQAVVNILTRHHIKADPESFFRTLEAAAKLERQNQEALRLIDGWDAPADVEGHDDIA